MWSLHIHSLLAYLFASSDASAVNECVKRNWNGPGDILQLIAMGDASISALGPADYSCAGVRKLSDDNS